MKPTSIWLLLLLQLLEGLLIYHINTLPSITVRCINIDPKIQQKFNYVVMASTNCIVQRGNSFIIRFAGIIHLGEKQVWLYENIFMY